MNSFLFYKLLYEVRNRFHLITNNHINLNYYGTITMQNKSVDIKNDKYPNRLNIVIL